MERNLFKVPTSKAGKAFVCKFTSMLQAYADQSVLESMALHVVVVMLAIRLKKSHSKSKVANHTIHLECHLQL